MWSLVSLSIICSFLVHGEASKMDDLAAGLKVDLSDRYNQGLLDVGVEVTPED